MKKTIVTLEDDLDGTKAAETIEFALDGTVYEIDLNARHASKLRKDLAAFVEKARVVRSSKKPSKKGKASRDDLGAIRAWAQQQGYAVARRGRVPKEIKAAYDAQHRGHAA